MMTTTQITVSDFIDPARLEPRTLPTAPFLCPDCGSTMPSPTGHYGESHRCACRIWRPSRAPKSSQGYTNQTPVLLSLVVGWYSSGEIVGAMTVHGAMQYGVIPTVDEARRYEQYLRHTADAAIDRELEEKRLAAQSYARLDFPATDDQYLMREQRASSRMMEEVYFAGDHDPVTRCMGCGWVIVQPSKHAPDLYHRYCAHRMGL